MRNERVFRITHNESRRISSDIGRLMNHHRLIHSFRISVSPLTHQYPPLGFIRKGSFDGSLTQLTVHDRIISSLMKANSTYSFTNVELALSSYVWSHRDFQRFSGTSKP